MSQTRHRGRTRPQHLTHHSRNCTQPTSSFPWLLVAVSLPASVLIFYNVLVPFVANLVGISVAMVNPYHLTLDVWLQLTSTCPVLVDSRTRNLLVAIDSAEELINTNYDALLDTTMVTHRNILDVNDLGLLDFLGSLHGNTDINCEFHDYITNVTHALEDSSLFSMVKTEGTEPQCIAARLSCDKTIDLSKAFDKKQVNAPPIRTVNGVIIMTEPVDFVPVDIFTDNQLTHVSYIQMQGSVALYCQMENNQNSGVQFNLNKGDAVRLDREKCTIMTISGRDSLAIGIIINT